MRVIRSNSQSIARNQVIMCLAALWCALATAGEVTRSKLSSMIPLRDAFHQIQGCWNDKRVGVCVDPNPPWAGIANAGTDVIAARCGVRENVCATLGCRPTAGLPLSIHTSLHEP